MFSPSCYTEEVNLLDILFPKRCVGCKALGAYLCPTCFSSVSFTTQYLCFVCNRSSLDGLTHPVCKKQWSIDGIYSSLVYSGVVKKMLYQFKYQPYLTDLRAPLVDLFYEGIIQHELLMKAVTKETVLIPVPLFPTKQRKRGYNQAEILANGIGDKMGLEVKDILTRKRQTNSQFSLDREKRKANMLDAFAIKSGVKDIPSTVFLVDDVATSGATLIECAKVLRRYGVKKVYGMTLAHGQ